MCILNAGVGSALAIASSDRHHLCVCVMADNYSRWHKIDRVYRLKESMFV